MVGNGMLFTNDEFSTNYINDGWETIEFNFTTGINAGQEFLYIGGLNNVQYLLNNENENANYYIDNVSLIQLDNTSFNLPSSICSSLVINNLSEFLVEANPTGVFTGTEVSLDANGNYVFDSTLAGLGNHEITYSFTNANGCPITLSDTILVSDNCAIPFISQTFHGGDPQQYIEVKNPHLTQKTAEEKYYLALYKDGASTSLPPTSFIEIPVISPNAVLVFKNPLADDPNNAFIELPTTFDFDADNDIVIITSTTDATAWNERYDIVGGATDWGFKKTLIRSACATNVPRTDTFDTDDWIVMEIEDVQNNYPDGSRTNPELGRHNQDTLFFTTVGSWNDTSLDESRPDPSRYIVLESNYSTLSNGNLEACRLELNPNVTATIEDSNYIRVQVNINVAANATIEVKDRGSLVQVKDQYSGVVGNDLIVLQPTANISIERKTVGLDAYTDYVFWSSPLSLHPDNLPANSVASLFPSPTFPANRFYGVHNANFFDGNGDLYDDNGDDYYVLNTAQRNQLMTPGLGYDTWPKIIENPLGGFDYTITFNGHPNNGAVSVPVYYNNPSPTALNDNLVGNPYPSAINLNRFFEVNADLIAPIAYIWGREQDEPTAGNPGPEALNYSEANFLVYNPTMMLIPNPSGTPATDYNGNPPFNDEGILASCQSFFVNTTNSNGTLIFNNSMRTVAPNNTFARNTANTVAIGKGDKLWLNLSSEDKTAQLGIAFSDQYNDGFLITEDVKNLPNRSLSFYSLVNETELLINAQNNFKNEKIIPLGISSKMALNKEYTINVNKLSGELNDYTLYIIDKETF
jgi:hypothetical protein